jgi:hypothetical protein
MMEALRQVYGAAAIGDELEKPATPAKKAAAPAKKK